MNLGSLLSRNIGGLPAWAWGGIVIGGGLALWYFFRRSGGAMAGPSGQQQQVDTSQIDPYTGVPYSIEEAINPATGLPAYYGGPGVDQTTTPPPAPGPGPTAPPTNGAPVVKGQPIVNPNPPVTPTAPTAKPTPPVAPVSPDHPVRRRPVQRPPKVRRRRRGDARLGIGDGPDEGSGQGPDEGAGGQGSGPNGGACPFGLNCGGGCQGHCQRQSTPFWPVMTDTGRY